ncbi:MAG: hypothetical protein ACE5EX_09125 [Phycisphaerae bacterium]
MPSSLISLIGLVLLAACLLILVLVGAMHLMARRSRRLRAAIGRRPPKPTISSDLWAQHKLPPELDDDSENMGGDTSC